MAKTNGQTPLSRFALLGSITLVVAILYFASEVLMPLALAILLSFLLAPVCTRLERQGLPRPAAVVVVVLLVLGLVVGLGYVVTGQIVHLAKNLPSYREEMRSKLASLRSPGGDVVQRVRETVRDIREDLGGTTQPATKPVTIPETIRAPETDTAAAPSSPPATLPHSEMELTMASGGNPPEPIPVRVVSSDPEPVQVLLNYADNLFEPLVMAGIVFVFVIFMLIQRADLRDRIIRLAGQGRINITTTALDDAGRRISRYLLATAIINGTYGLAIGLGLWLIGWVIGGGTFPNVVLWALLCAVLRFIPYVGPWLAASFPLIVSFVAFPGFSVFAATVVLFIVVELLSNNWMEPWLYGSSTGMSTLAVLVSAVFWTWLWGPLGLVMATPLTTCLLVLGRHVPQWSFFPILLGDQPVLDPPERLYQRLLALDAEEAEDLLDERLQQTSLAVVFDEVLIPALALAERDRHRGDLDPQRQQFIHQTIAEWIDDLPDRPERSDTPWTLDRSENGASSDAPSLPQSFDCRVLCLPAYDVADELVGRMLLRLLQSSGVKAELVSVNRLRSEMIEQVRQTQADLVCISALPPSATAHARYLYKRLMQVLPDQSVLVGLWTLRGDLAQARRRVGCDGRNALTTSLAGAMQLIRERLLPKLHAAGSRYATSS